ncbi:MAG: hypothetical protein R2749_18700 [Acidimicrobiales bacterium]
MAVRRLGHGPAGEGWRAPLYWEAPEADRLVALHARRPAPGAGRDEPVVYVSFFEADAFARAGARLPSEHE